MPNNCTCAFNKGLNCFKYNSALGTKELLVTLHNPTPDAYALARVKQRVSHLCEYSLPFLVLDLFSNQTKIALCHTIKIAGISAVFEPISLQNT